MNHSKKSNSLVVDLLFNKLADEGGAECCQAYDVGRVALAELEPELSLGAQERRL